MGETVGLFLIGLNNDYQERLREDALKRAKHLGFTIDVQLADNDPARQIEQIMAAIERRRASGMVAMLVCPVSEGSLALAARAVASAGMEWVLLNRVADYLNELKREFPQRVIFTVLPDQLEIGRIQGWQTRALAAEGDQILCVTGRPDTWSARHRLAGLKEIVGAANPIATVAGDWTSEGGRRAVETWLEANVEVRRPGPGVVVAQNDDMALGARQSLRDAATRWSLPIANVPIVGCDGSPRFGQRLVREHRLACTVAVSSAAGPALDWLHRARAGAERPATQVVLPVTSFPAIEELSRRAG